MANHRVLTSDQDIAVAIEQAGLTSDEPRVKSAQMALANDVPVIALQMDDGSLHSIPRAKLQGLANASTEAVSNLEISDDGFAIRWPDLDLDYYVPYLLQGVYGTKAWMASLGKRGGESRTEAKCNAARKNGLKGGRPRKLSKQIDATTSVPGFDLSASAVTDYRFQFRYNRDRYASLFGIDEVTNPRILPRIA